MAVYQLILRIISFLLIGLLLICFYFWQRNDSFSESFEPFPEKVLQEESVREIIGNSLRLDKYQWKVKIPSLKKKMQIVLKSPRPDSYLPSRLEIYLKDSSEKREISFGEKLFLNVDPKEKLIFGDSSSGYWIKAILLNNEEIEIETGIDSEENIDLCFVDQKFILKSSAKMLLDTQKECFKTLVAMKWIGQDLLMKTVRKERLAFNNNNICYVEIGDFLIWKDSCWQVINDLKKAKDCPLVKVKSTTIEKMELECWDVDSNNKYCFVLLPFASHPIKTKITELMSSIRLRTRHQISCQLGKQYFILKPKDRLIHKGSLWKLDRGSVKAIENLSDNLDDIFVFEKIEEVNSQKVVKGFLFNGLHNQMQSIEIPLSDTVKKRGRKY